jgi:putative transposase
VRRLMGIMGLQVIYKGPNTSKMHPQYKDLAILIKKAVDHARTSCLVQRYYLHSVKNGFLYPAAIMDWATRKVLS